MPWPQHWLIQSPAWLWLLAALAIPVLIHLLKRSNPQEITFAAVHWLQQKRHRRWKKLFLRDRLLLLLRCLLLLPLILLLAQPVLLRSAQPSDKILLVDPEVTPEALQRFLAEHREISETFWLQANPTPTNSPRPAAPDLWQTLSQLAAAGEFRRAHILLQHSDNPAGHNALSFSPHWQWHAAETDVSQATAATPRIALLGEGPVWLQPLIQQLAEGPLPQLELQQLSATAAPDASEIDWVIYDTPGPIPASLRDFVHAGGLLISDARVTGDPTTNFAALDAGSTAETAVIGRGSWLRYRDDWHSEKFFHSAELPQKLWQQWSARDWLWQDRSRGRWSIDSPPGTALADAAVTARYQSPVDTVLLFAFALLLLLERSISLSRRDVVNRGRDDA